ncbi:hypothetical protein TNIN_101521 [Trichonephila inaurata madagascariensis]|uniref:Uncharacterized protein n=1 Tax=Trichonephila inaurata madagascariensis TaxID=2747483 RepID=A0A8X7CPT1_9ARAC|nr:hypothetical protein TNIN_101521 [Trichonephila inaurata madagascariensis]
MNPDDSDLSSLADEDDYQSDNGSEMDGDNEDHEYILAKDKQDEPFPKRIVTTYIPHQAAPSKEARNMPEMVGNWTL